MRHLDLADVGLTHRERAHWRDVLSMWRDRMLTRPDIYRWALSNPVTRWFTQYRTRQVFDLMAGFVHTQVLLGCVRLKILENLMESPKTLAELSAFSRVPEAGLQRLIQSAVTLRLLERRGQHRFGLGPLGAPIVSHPGIRAMIEHNQLLYQDMTDPVAILHESWSGEMSEYWPYAQAGEAQEARKSGAADAAQTFARYSELMAASQTFVIEEILSSYPFQDCHCVLDVGGGQGRFASELAQTYPHLRITLFDLPDVCKVSSQSVARKGLSERIQVVPGDFTQDALPKGADLVTLVRIAHDHCDAVVLALLKSIYESLPAGGSLLIAEPMANEPGEKSDGEAYFHFYLLAMGSGRLRTPMELMQLMHQAGFSHIEQIPNPMPVHAKLLLGRKSKCLP
ncbi:MAG: methyltransferase domain-containing protein [Burkholderiales bacterium]|nr:methyltransferase domain-containing protein [Burkholderiales bacterium]